MAEALVAGAILSAASKEVVNFFKRQKLNDKLLHKLKIEMKTVSQLLEDAEKKQNTEKAVRDWLDDLKDFAYEADDFLDEIAYDHTLVQLELEAGPTTCSGQARKLFSSLNPCKKGMRELEPPRLKDILDKLEDLLQQKDGLGLEKQDGANPSSLSLQGGLTTSIIDEYGVYGREDDKEAIVKLLLSNNASSTYPDVVPIVGMGGIGKTTLAQIAFQDSRVEGKFDKLKAWVCVSEEVDVIKLAKNILREIGLSDCDSMTPNQLQLELEEKVRGETILLVLDDVWNNIDWEFLLLPLKSAAQGSKVLVTTRAEWVVSVVRTVPIYNLNELSEDDCWSLFEKLALDGCDSDADAHLKELGRKIVRKCKGIPLAAKTIGGILRFDRGVGKWEQILESNMWDLNDGRIIPALKLSYHYLPSHLKQCFAYCAMFPKGFQFRREDLTLLWMAEGFIVQHNNERREMEEIGEEYFEALASRSFFQKCEYTDYFIMHDLINDLAKSIAGQFCYNYLEGSSGQLTKRTRHLFYEAGNGCNEELEKLSKAELLRTFICSIKGDETRQVADFIPRLRLLRVLRLSGDRMRRLYRERVLDRHRNAVKEEEINLSCLVGSTKHLRYMRLFDVPILNLPETMPNLQTLIINHSENLTSLPNSIGEMKSLRHLSLRRTGIKSLPDSIGNLKDLRHLDLGETYIKRLPESICGLDNLQYLSLQGCSQLVELPAKMMDLCRLDISGTKLKSTPPQMGKLSSEL